MTAPVFFLIVVALVTVAVLISVVNDSLWGAGAFLVGLVVMHFTGHLIYLEYALPLPTTWWGWLLLALAYLATGAIWSFYKFYVVYRDEVRGIAERHKEKPLEERRRAIEQFSPKVSTMKESILSWIAYWPLSMLVYLFYDLLRHVVTAVYNRLAGRYEKIARHIRESYIK